MTPSQWAPWPAIRSTTADGRPRPALPGLTSNPTSEHTSRATSRVPALAASTPASTRRPSVGSSRRTNPVGKRPDTSVESAAPRGTPATTGTAARAAASAASCPRVNPMVVRRARSASESRTRRVINCPSAIAPAMPASAVRAQRPRPCASTAVRTAGLTISAGSRLSVSLRGRVSGSRRKAARSTPGCNETAMMVTATPRSRCRSSAGEKKAAGDGSSSCAGPSTTPTRVARSLGPAGSRVLKPVVSACSWGASPG